MAEDWDFYIVQSDGVPASTFVNLGMRSNAPVAAYLNLGSVRIWMKAPREDGLSSDEEFETLAKIEDEIVNAATQGGRTIYVGRNTTCGYRDCYFYTGDVDEFESAVTAVTATHPDYKAEIETKRDESWSTYLGFLYPSPPSYQSILNRRVCTQLEAHGDLLSVERNIDHMTKFPDKSSAEAFAQYVKASGFTIKAIHKERFLSKTRFVEFVRKDAPNQMDSVVISMLEKLDTLGGSYDGWGCSVVTE